MLRGACYHVLRQKGLTETLTNGLYESVPKPKTVIPRKKFMDFFCNKTIWSLFHYFPLYAKFDEVYWESYKRVNEVFAEYVLKIVHDNDTVWVHDYHLMLLPKLIREELPKATIGFFLHISFPSFEMFRLLPQRREILEGVLGADLEVI